MSDPTDEQAVVFVIDDDEDLRDGLSNLMRSVGLQVRAFASAMDFLKSSLPDTPSCLVLDVRLPGVSGLDFQSELIRKNIGMPIVFMSAHGDIPMTVRAMKAGAVEFLPKPFHDQSMLDAVHSALEKDRQRRKGIGDTSQLRSSFDSLTPREQQILAYVASGLMNKQIAAETELSEITVKVHRASVMRKMGAKSLADLVRMADALGVRPPKS
jgi:FixJ family two-component response regulator